MKYVTVQKMKFSIKDFPGKRDQIRRKLQIWSQLLKIFLMENFIFCQCVQSPATLVSPCTHMYAFGLRRTNSSTTA